LTLTHRCKFRTPRTARARHGASNTPLH